MLKRFEQQIEELHQNNFVHGDFQRPTTVFNRGDQKWMYKNIVQTEQGLRLLDAGFGTKLDKDNIKLFVSILIRERDEVKYFRSYYIGSSTEKNMNTSLP
jgi:tRNA A-37 threonylcarbamoyl transferase component Bud32